jgi:transcriptional regulator with XRE-family HTH domain
MEKKETTLKRVRASKGFTQKGLSEATGISLRTIQHWEQGSKDFNQAAAMTVYAVSQALGVDMIELLDIPGPEETDEN